MCVPTIEELPALVIRNRQRPELANVEWFGRSLAEIAASARQEILSDALAYTRQYTDLGDSPGADQPLILTGHQPELFHPGVWLKNFEAARLATTCGGTAINLIIDSDLCRSPAVRVPTGSASELQAEIVPFDQAMTELPFEERLIAEPELWKSFGSRVVHNLESLINQPLVKEWWPTVLAEGQKTEKLGYAISQARHQLELEWGSRSLELPQSHVCRSEGFRLFALQLWGRADEFRAAYNAALADYRLAHGLKNHAQPVPDLVAHEDWIETPFWLWSSTEPVRRGVFLRRVGSELEFTDRNKLSCLIPLDAALALEKLAELESQGIKLRTRALATTLFARLLLADVFIHGIGGAKYDQVTDAICGSFFGLALPAYATISGTLRLPIPSPNITRDSVGDLRQELRGHRFHPECFVDAMQIPAAEVSRVEAAIAKKRDWIHIKKTLANAAARHQTIVAINEELQPFLNNRQQLLERQIVAAKLAASAELLRNSREYAYCLFPRQDLQNFFRL
ncbi:MAG: hypothetical protein SH868_17590 [Bythopirellula sp.]|nr:hypothetical protein [Bythopirellula sp.]